MSTMNPKLVRLGWYIAAWSIVAVGTFVLLWIGQ